jgi:hypothetical protein
MKAQIGPFTVGLAARSGAFTVYRGCSVVAAGEWKRGELREYRQTGPSEIPTKGAIIGALRSLDGGDTAPAKPTTALEAVEPPHVVEAVPAFYAMREEPEPTPPESRALASRRRSKKPELE